MKKTLIIVGIFALAGVAAWPFIQSQMQLQALREDVHVVLLEQPEPIKTEFTLRDHKGDVFNQARLLNKWTVMFFGYTHCPDICPQTLSIMQQAASRVRMDQVQYIFVSVDPDRDTQEALSQFIRFYGEPFIGVTGERGQLDAFTEALHISYEIERNDDGSVDEVAHDASILLIDPKARLRAALKPAHKVDRVVDAIREVVTYYGT